MRALRNTVTFAAILGLLLSGFGATSASAQEPAEAFAAPTAQAPMSGAKWITSKVQPSPGRDLSLAADFTSDENVSADYLRWQTPAKWFIEENKYIRSALNGQYLGAEDSQSSMRPILVSGKEWGYQEWVLSEEDDEGYVSIRSAAHPALFLMIWGDKLELSEYRPENGPESKLWSIDDAFDPSLLHEGRSVAIRPTGKRTLSINTPTSVHSQFTALSPNYDWSTSAWKVSQIRGSYLFQNQETKRFLTFNGETLETAPLNKENDDVWWEIFNDPIGTVELSPHPGSDRVVMGVASDELMDGGKPSKIPRGSKEAKFDLTDVGGAYGHLIRQKISPQANPAMGINIPSGRGDQAYLWDSDFGPIAHWSQELGTYVFKTNFGNMAWDSSKGNKVINWPGDYSDMRWIPRVTRKGTILVNYKDQKKVLAFTGTDGAVYDPIIVDDFKNISQQYWNVKPTVRMNSGSAPSDSWQQDF